MIRNANFDFIIKYTLFSAVCAFFTFHVEAQTVETNLISNPSLDEIEICTDNPFYISNGSVLMDWWTWQRGLNGSRLSPGRTDWYINTCHEDLMNGWVTSVSGPSSKIKPISPRTGSGHYYIASKSGMVPDHDPNIPPFLDTIRDRLFLKNRLTEPLEAGKTYLFLFYQRGVRWEPNFASTEGITYNCASPSLGAYFSIDTNTINSRMTTRGDLFSAAPQIEWDDYELDTNQWTLMVGCFTAKGGERYLTLGRFNEETESDLENCQDYFVSNDGDTILVGSQLSIAFQTERLFVDDFALYDLDAFTFEDQEHCLLDSFFFEDPYEMGFVATYGDDTLNHGWVAPGPGTYEIDIVIGECSMEKTFEIEVSPCFTCLPEIDPIELCPDEEYFNPRDYVESSFHVPDTLIKSCPGTYEFFVLHPHCSDPIGQLKIEVLPYAECFDYLPLDIQCLGTQLELPEGDRFVLDVGDDPIPSVWIEPTEIPYQFSDTFCNTEVESGIMRVIECEDCDIYIPNVFSPNGDGINDYFSISTACDVQSAVIQIFDRQGRLIAESRQLDRIWNGLREQPGVYVYRAQIEHTVAEGTQVRNFTGSLTLVK